MGALSWWHRNVVSGSTQRGRAEVEPDAVPRALAYYKELERRSDTAYVASPYGAGAKPVPVMPVKLVRPQP